MLSQDVENIIFSPVNDDSDNIPMIVEEHF